MTLQNIKHVVTLMLENHSFDNVLGSLYAMNARPEFNGLTGNETNPDSKAAATVKVQAIKGTTVQEMVTPNPDPGEEWVNMNEQIFGHGKNCTTSGTETMSGFVDNYLAQSSSSGFAPQAQEIMSYFTDTQLPALHQLAREFAVCDTWYASVPCQTLPNRIFLHAGQNSNIVNNTPLHKWLPFLDKTLFDLVENSLGKNERRIYYGDLPTTLTFARLWDDFLANNGTFREYDLFKRDVDAGDLAAYTHIEPKYLQGASKETLPNDMHPPHHVGLADQLIADVYTILRNSPFWENTLLIITFDEHGGIYDHQAPPSAVPPSPYSKATDTCPKDQSELTFTYNRYGVRVPTVIISPYIQAGTILKPPAGSNYPYDHTSVIATVGACFNLDVAELKSDRVNSAPTLANVLTLNTARTDCPETVIPFDKPLSEADFEELLKIQAPNILQDILAYLIKVIAEHKMALQEVDGDIEKISDTIHQYVKDFKHELLPQTRIKNFETVMAHLELLSLKEAKKPLLANQSLWQSFLHWWTH